MIEIDGSQIDLARVAAVCARYGLAELAVFGSTVRGEASRDSDVDAAERIIDLAAARSADR